MGRYYILKDKGVQKANLEEWANYFESSDRVIKKTKLFDDSVEVSTVFLGLDHAIPENENHPLVFETMVFGGTFDGLTERYSTYKQAEEGHEKVADGVSNGNL